MFASLISDDAKAVCAEHARINDEDVSCSRRLIAKLCAPEPSPSVRYRGLQTDNHVGARAPHSLCTAMVVRRVKACLLWQVQIVDKLPCRLCAGVQAQAEEALPAEDGAQAAADQVPGHQDLARQLEAGSGAL